LRSLSARDAEGRRGDIGPLSSLGPALPSITVPNRPAPASTVGRFC
jgi:hypothetical protein